MQVGDPERTRATDALRRHYVDGRLTDVELEQRVGVALAARTRSDLRNSLTGLPRGVAFDAAGVLRRALVVVAAFGAWCFVSSILLVAFVATLVVAGASAGVFIGFPLAWFVLTLLLFRAAAGRGLRHRR
jgi:hypothetical protein